MDDGQFRTLMSVAMVPAVVSLIMEGRGLGFREALDAFYRSETFEMLSEMETDVWHFSPVTIYGIWSGEAGTGVPAIPEGFRWKGGTGSLSTASSCTARGTA